MANGEVSPRLILLAALAMAVAALLPLLQVTYPVLQDLPNHLARIVVLRAAPGDPQLDYYQVNWQVIPNLAMDWVMLALASVLPLAAATKVAIVVLGALWLAAPLVLHRVLYGRFSVLPLVGGLFLFNRVVDFGFLNFWLGSSLVVMAFAAWVLLGAASFWRRALLGVAMATVLFFCHLYAFGTFIVVIAIWEGFAPASTNRSRAERLTTLCVLAAPGIVGLWLGPDELVGAAGQVGYISDLTHFAVAKLTQMRDFVSPHRLVGTITLLAIVGLVAWALVQRRTDRRMVLICAALFALFLLLPYRFMSGVHVDWRMLAPLSLFAAGSIRLDLSRMQALVLSGAIAVLFALQVAVTVEHWRIGEGRYREYEAILEAVPPNSRLLYSTVGMPNGRFDGGPSVLHYSGLATVERNAVVPSLFAFASQQPIRVVPKYAKRHQSLVRGWVRTVDQIDWPIVHADFDYAILAADAAPVLPDGFTPMASAGVFHLYRVDPK